MEEELSPEEQEQEQKRKGSIHSVMSFVLALAVILVGVGAMLVFEVTGPEPETVTMDVLVPTVSVKSIVRGEHQVVIDTQGLVKSRREVRLAAEVGGRVVRISDQLVEGGRVSEGDLLVEIDEADFRAAVAQAKSSLADARLMLEQEKARAKQAESDWEKLGRGTPTDLVMRIPQIESATARIASAESAVERAENDLKRTKILAPFGGRVRMSAVEAGAVMNPGSLVAEIYSDQDLEVRLPFPLRDFGYLGNAVGVEFDVIARIGGVSASWPAKLVRIEGEVERSTLSGHGIAKVMPNEKGLYPPVGLFVEAAVPGRTLDGVIDIPRAAVRGRNEVWVENGGELWARTVEILRSGRMDVVARGDFEAGDQLVLTRLDTPLDGMKVEAQPEEPEGE